MYVCLLEQIFLIYIKECMEVIETPVCSKEDNENKITLVCFDRLLIINTGATFEGPSAFSTFWLGVNFMISSFTLSSDLSLALNCFKASWNLSTAMLCLVRDVGIFSDGFSGMQSISYRKTYKTIEPSICMITKLLPSTQRSYNSRQKLFLNR